MYKISEIMYKISEIMDKISFSLLKNTNNWLLEVIKPLVKLCMKYLFLGNYQHFDRMK